MPRNILLLCITIFAFLSCSKKGNPDPPKPPSDPIDSVGKYYLRCKIDGVLTNFPDQARATYLQGDNWNLVVEGVNLPQAMAIGIGDNISAKPIIPGSYADTTVPFRLRVSYTPDEDTTIYYAGYDQYYFADLNHVTIIHHFQVTIDSMDQKTIKGTFSGDMYKQNINGSVLQITEGEFFQPFKAN